MLKQKNAPKTREEKEDEFYESIEEAAAEKTENESYGQSLENEPEWIDEESEEGQLSVDVYEEGDNIMVKSTIAGVEADDIDISIVNDMLTIRGERKREKEQKGKEYFFQECYWGAFSRSIILPVEVNVKKIDATIKNGILTIVLPKLKTTAKKKIKIKDEN